MQIRRSRRVKEQIAIARELQAELLRLIRNKLRRAESHELAAEWQSLLTLIELSAPGYRVKTRPRGATEIERRASMLTGPFFTSAAHPTPTDERGQAMVPLLQLQLEDVWPAIQQEHEGGLMQLWLGLSPASSLIRLIPTKDVAEQDPTPFFWNAPEGLEPSLIPNGWNLDPCGNTVQEIVELVATGFECQAGYIEACYGMVAPDKPEWLWTLLKLFMEKAPYRPRQHNGAIKLFGTFSGIQYNAADVGLPCLMSMSWGASGGAQLFFQARKNEPLRIEFRSCGR